MAHTCGHVVPRAGVLCHGGGTLMPVADKRLMARSERCRRARGNLGVASSGVLTAAYQEMVNSTGSREFMGLPATTARRVPAESDMAFMRWVWPVLLVDALAMA